MAKDPTPVFDKTSIAVGDGTPAATKNIAYLDGWRGLAILSVLVAHFSGPGPLAWMGGFGVALFFALSGFLMSHLLFTQKVNLQGFFVRRFNRVIPTFIFFVGAMSVYALTIQPVKYQVSVSDLFATLFFIRAYVPSDLDIFSDFWPAGHLWSLSVEEHSYLFLALIAFIAHRVKNKYATNWLLVASCLIIFGFNIYYVKYPPHSASPWAVRSECAALGLVLSATMRHIRSTTSWDFIKNPSRLLPILSFLIAIACFSTYSYKIMANPIAVFCLAFTINYLDRVPKFFTNLISFKLIRWFGICSFSMYLWQQPFYLAVRYHQAPKVEFLIGAILTGVISFYFLENPTRVKLNSLWGRCNLRASSYRVESAP